MLKESRTIGAGESALQLALCDDHGYRFLILTSRWSDEPEIGAVMIDVDDIETLVAALLALKTTSER